MIAENNAFLTSISQSICLDDRLYYNQKQPTARAWFDQINLHHVWNQSLGYAGTTKIVSLHGAYYVSPNFGGEQVLIRGDDDQIFLRGNLCPHRQAQLLKDEGGVLRKHPKHGRVTQCDLHRWAFAERGGVIGVPKGFQDCRHLEGLMSEPVSNWRGHLFAEGKAENNLLSFGESRIFDPSLFDMENFCDMVTTRHYETPYNSLVFDLNYLDCYHVGPSHPKTFGEVADTNTLKWEFGNGYSVQVVSGVSTGQIPDHEGPSWANLATLMYESFPETKEQPFAVWAHVYPGHMLELYFGKLLAVSYLVPISPTECDNVVEYYMSNDVYEEFGDGFMEEFIRTYRTSADEDDKLCIEIQKGWQLLARRGRGRMFGPFHNPMEDGMVHYLKWLQGIDGFRFDI